MLPMAKPIHWLPQKFSVYLLLMECKMITYTKSPMHSLAKWWLWSSPEQSFQVELKDITDGDATRIMQSKYWLKPKLGETYVRFLNTVIHTVRFYQKYWHFHKLCERSVKWDKNGHILGKIWQCAIYNI